MMLKKSAKTGQKGGGSNSSSSGSFSKSDLPMVVSKRILVPFEFRFTSQDVGLEIRDTSDNSLLYEVQIPFEQLLSEPQIL
jgi:hypothetical protein